MRHVIRPVQLGLLLAMLLCSAACKERYIEVGAPKARTKSETIGNGPSARAGRIVTINYTLTADDGSTVLQDDEYAFELGANTVIGAVEDTVLGMRVGGRRVVECPPETHWGRAGYAEKIKPNMRLTLAVELLAVE